MRKLLGILCSLLVTTIFQGCDDNVDLDEVETDVEYTITACNSPDTELYIRGTGLPSDGLYCKGGFKNKCKTKGYYAQIEVRCDDPTVLLEVILYVRNKKVVTRYDNRFISLRHVLKGNPL